MVSCIFFGFGVMGYFMVGYFKVVGYDVIVWNCMGVKLLVWVEEYGGQVVDIVEVVIVDVDFVMMCLGDDFDVFVIVEQVILVMKFGVILIDYIIVFVEFVCELDMDVCDVGIGFIDVLVFGGQVGVENGQLIIMCGGELDIFVCVELVMDVYVKVMLLIGLVGLG